MPQSFAIARTPSGRELEFLPAMANRHGLVTGATGTGKTVTLQLLTDRFSSIGVPVFLADVKGDLSGVAAAGSLTPKLAERLKAIHAEPPDWRADPAVFWDVFGRRGFPVRATVSDFGPLLLGRQLGLNATQEGVLAMVFKIADDSGLCVDALGGAPGVISAHYAAIATNSSDRETHRRVQDAANNALLLERLSGVVDRRARFVSTLVAIRSADDPEPLVAVGRWQGEILVTVRGAGGFGYDPLMFIPSLDRSVAELDAVTKNAHSHRALAAAQMLVLMREAWRLG